MVDLDTDTTWIRGAADREGFGSSGNDLERESGGEGAVGVVGVGGRV